MRRIRSLKDSGLYADTAVVRASASLRFGGTSGRPDRFGLVRASDRLFLIVVPGAALASVDLFVKLKFPTELWAYHHRSHAWIVASVVLLLAVASLAFVRSRAVALAAGVMCGGVIGNLVSARANGNWVPNPLMIVDYGHILAFNPADVFFVVGDLLLMPTLIVVALRSHHFRLLATVTFRRREARHS